MDQGDLALARLDTARRVLAEARTVDEVKAIRDKAEAMRLYTKQAGMGLEAQNHAAEIKLYAERRAGELLAQTIQHQGGRPTKNGSTLEPFLPEGVSKQQSHRSQLEASVPADVFARYVEATKAAGQELTSARVLQLAREPSLAVHFSSATAEWYTPPVIIARVVRVLGAIDLDPCSNDGAQPYIPAQRHYTPAQDGLRQPWAGRVYLNPPYGQAIGAWVEKLAHAHAAGDVSAAVALVPARTDTEWWQWLQDCAVCLVKGRLRFSGSENDAPFPSAVAYLGPDTQTFAHTFRDLGPIWVRLDDVA
jgi:hypothetical protein